MSPERLTILANILSGGRPPYPAILPPTDSLIFASFQYRVLTLFIFLEKVTERKRLSELQTHTESNTAHLFQHDFIINRASSTSTFRKQCGVIARNLSQSAQRLSNQSISQCDKNTFHYSLTGKTATGSTTAASDNRCSDVTEPTSSKDNLHSNADYT